MRTKSTVTWLSVGLLVFGLSSGVVWAQATAQISGTARDQDGGVLPGVDVTVTHIETGLTRTTITNETGSYALPNLPLGTHRLEASLPGFRTYVQTGIVLQVNSSPAINPVLDVGEVTESVVVVANAALVETRNVGVAQVIENERILALPLNGRNVADLIVLTGQAVQTGTTGAGGRSARSGDPSLYIAGGVRAGTAYLLDGVPHTNLLDVIPLPYPFPEALQEFKVETAGLSAEHDSGAAVSAVTKSGTNQFHGALFEFARLDALNARSYFARAKSTLKRHQFGGTLGGPIVRNRLFFFGGYQRTALRRDPANVENRIVTPAMLAGDWTAVASPACNAGRQINLASPFVNNRIDPAQFSGPAVEIARRFLAESPVQDACGRVVFGRKRIEDETMVVSKIDYQINDKHSLFGRAVFDKFDSPPPSSFSNPLLNAPDQGADTSTQAYAVGSTYVISATSVNSLRFSFNREYIIRVGTSTFDPSDVGINAVSHTRGHIGLVVGGFNLGNGPFFHGDTLHNNRTISIEDDFTFIRGTHQLKFGGALQHQSAYTAFPSYAAPVFSFSGAATGLGLGDLMLGRPAQMVQGSPPVSTFLQWLPTLYAQDAWQATPNVTVSLGLRWEPELPAWIKEGKVANFDLERFRQGIYSTRFTNAPAGLYFPGDPGFPGKSGVYSRWGLTRLAPRAGVAWDVQGDGRTSIRASYGLSFHQQNMSYYYGTFEASPFFNRVTLAAPAGGLADPWRGVPGGQPFPLPPQPGPDAQFVPSAGYMSLRYDRDQPHSSSFNVTIQKQIATQWISMASYVGSRARHLWGTRMLNPAVYFFNGTSTCTLPNGQTITGSGTQCSTVANTSQRRTLTLERPQDGQLLGRVTEFDTDGKQDYNGLLLSLERRAASGVSVGANYTLAKCMQHFISNSNPNTDFAYPDPNNLDAEWGNCFGSRRQIVNLTGLVESPQFVNPTLRVIASGWRLSGIYRWSTGTYLTVLTGGVDRALSDITLNQRPDQVLADPYKDRSGRPFTQYVNPAAFALQAVGTNGNVRPGSIEGPGTWQLDAALSRMIRLSENQGMEFRVEAYNLTNSFRPGDPVTRINSPLFGQIRTALDPRILQFAVKYVF